MFVRPPKPQPPKLPPEPLTLKFKCPYCKHEIDTGLYPNIFEDDFKDIQTCYKEDGGCGKDFVLVVEREIKYKILKIEGED